MLERTIRVRTAREPKAKVTAGRIRCRTALLKVVQVPSQQTVHGIEARHLRRGIDHDVKATVSWKEAQPGEEQDLQEECNPEDGHRDPTQRDERGWYDPGTCPC